MNRTPWIVLLLALLPRPVRGQAASTAAPFPPWDRLPSLYSFDLNAGFPYGKGPALGGLLKGDSSPASFSIYKFIAGADLPPLEARPVSEYAALEREYEWANPGRRQPEVQWRPWKVLALKAGYRPWAPGTSGSSSGLTFGAGLAWKRLYLDYACIPQGDLSQNQYLSLAVTLWRQGR